MRISNFARRGLQALRVEIAVLSRRGFRTSRLGTAVILGRELRDSRLGHYSASGTRALTLASLYYINVEGGLHALRLGITRVAMISLASGI